MTTTADEMRFLAAWAERYGAVFQPHGECGFGRQCVGIVKDGEYPAYSEHEYSDGPPYAREWHRCPEAAPDSGATPDAYHKHDCLAVLGRGDGAIHQLYLWVQKLERESIGIVVRERRGRPIDLLLHGRTIALLAKVAEGVPGAPRLVTAEQLRTAGPGFEAPAR